MFCAEKDVEAVPRRVLARSHIYNICETLFLYYNGLISVLCRDKKNQRQGLVVFCLSMLKLSLIVLLISASAAFAADTNEDLKLVSGKASAERLSAIERVSRSRDPRALQSLRSGLKAEKNKITRARIIEALGNVASPEAAPDLITELKGAQDENSRFAAASSLALSRSAAGRAALIAVVPSSDTLSVRLASANSLTYYPPDDGIYACFSAALKDPLPEMRAQALTSLSLSFGVSRRKEVKAALQAASSDISGLVKKAAAERLEFMEAKK